MGTDSDEISVVDGHKIISKRAPFSVWNVSGMPLGKSTDTGQTHEFIIKTPGIYILASLSNRYKIIVR